MNLRLVSVVSVVAWSLACSGITDSLQEEIGKAVADQVVEGVLEGASGAEVDLAEGSVEVKTPDGTVTVGGQGEVPKDWPSDVPVYTGLTVLASVSGSAAGGGQMLSGETTDDAAKVGAFYVAQLSGWNKVAEVNTPQGQMWSFASADGKRTVSVIAGAGSDGKTAVQLAVTSAE